MNMDDQLQQITDLIEKTGDKAIVLKENKPAYVLMTLKDYERLILGKYEVKGLTEEELLDKINREIAVWRSGQERLKQVEEEAPLFDEPLSPAREPWGEPWDFSTARSDFADKSNLRPSLDSDEPRFENRWDKDDDDFEVPFDLDDEDDMLDEDSGSPIDSDESRFEEDKYYVEPIR
ncbi:type II toxin-antitoxin system Phd/YefM family antitoxin [Patescibacteria group bacterium]|nr:type II toxin-antitoxin system Phd/YefM family antitoxin [Patescibacteria group bacterium]MBU4512681.1 type II toxin-antitoxin system Phd/YefM family antitoxin [Patescibacteria group bacterium]MCG2693583.1 type II toxin-antitoxin system Phd/YefM family antitoxin [Candidatus Parcubacteria bacterium]